MGSENKYNNKIRMASEFHDRYSDVLTELVKLPIERQKDSSGQRLELVKQILSRSDFTFEDFWVDAFAAVSGIQAESLRPMINDDFYAYNHKYTKHHDSFAFWEAFNEAVKEYSGENGDFIPCVAVKYKQKMSGNQWRNDDYDLQAKNPANNVSKKILKAYRTVMRQARDHFDKIGKKSYTADDIIEEVGLEGRDISRKTFITLYYWFEVGTIIEADAMIEGEDSESDYWDYISDKSAQTGFRKVEGEDSGWSSFLDFVDTLLAGDPDNVKKICGKRSAEYIRAYMTNAMLIPLKLVSDDGRKRNDPENRFKAAPYGDMRIFEEAFYPKKEKVDKILHQDYLNKSITFCHRVEAEKNGTGELQLTEVLDEDAPAQKRIEETTYYPLKEDFGFRDSEVAEALCLSKSGYSKVKADIENALREYKKRLLSE